jgi:hypothetical protein
MKLNVTRGTVLWALRAVVIWLCATVALASAAIHSGTALRHFITPHYGGWLIFGAAFLLALLLGLAIESPKWAVALTFAMCLVASAVYGGVIYAPVWLDIAVSTIAFQNYVSQQVLLLFLWCIIPSITGVLIGCFAGAGLRPSRDASAVTADAGWWDRAKSPQS